MPIRSRFPQWMAAVLLPALAVGCATGDKSSAAGPSRLWVTDSGDSVPQSRGDLKNASMLDLSYARWQEQIGNMPQARESYQRVLKSDPDSADALLGLARIEQLAGRPEAAEQAYLRAIQAVPEKPQPYDALGQFYAAQQRWDDAVPALARAVQIAPNDGSYRHHYAAALARSGDTGQALVQFTHTVGEAEAHYNVGYILYEQGQVAAAEREFLQAVALRPDLNAATVMLDEIHGGGTHLVVSNPPAQPAVTQTAGIAANGRERVAPATATDDARRRWGKWAGGEQAPPSPAQVEQMRNQATHSAGS